MSDPAYRYVQLITSLPGHGPLFGATQTPLSAINLNQRLSLLEPEDKQILDKIADLMDWHRLRIERTDADIVELARSIMPICRNPFVRDLVEWRLESRTLIAALRHRRRGEEAPSATTLWGYGRWLATVRARWHEAHFGLERVFPWLPEAREYIDNGNALALEKLLLGMFWDHLDRVSEGHEFDFEAVLIYMMRWDLVARWVGYQGEGAVQRFDEMVEGALRDFDLDAVAP